MQRSRDKWLLEEECNTRYFYTLVILKRARSQILILQNKEGTWIEEADQLKEMAKTHRQSCIL